MALARFAEFIVERRFAPIRWQIDFSPTRRGYYYGRASSVF
jgi:hypothetical protein